jgi:hypothetical protein
MGIHSEPIAPAIDIRRYPREVVARAPAEPELSPPHTILPTGPDRRRTAPIDMVDALHG